GNNRDGYLKFSLSGIGHVSNATLRVYAKQADTPVRDLTVYQVADTNWGETSVTWNNRPSLGSRIVGQNVTTSYAWYSFDVSSYVRSEQVSGKTLITFGLHTTNGGSAVLNVRSREETEVPELVIVTNHPPTNFITQPSNSSTVSAPGITITAQAGDPDGTVTNVAFYAGSTLLANITSITNGSYLCTASIVGGVHTLKTVAYDNLGLTATSSVSVTVINVTDLNTNGVPDLLEDVTLSAPVPFANSPFIVTGVFEAEQFDAGGIGIAYSNVVAHPTNTYRVTGMWITNCNDIGQGYQVRVQAGEWARYTFKPQLAGDYVVSARAKGTNGGQIKFVFDNANGVSSYVTNVPALSSTNWENIQIVVTLSDAYNSLKVEGVVDAGGFAADLNYISVYGYVPPQAFPALTVTMGQTAPFTDWFVDTGTNIHGARSNSVTLQAAIDYVLSSGGGTIQFPAGRFYLAQQSTNIVEVPSHESGNYFNYAVRVTYFINWTNRIGDNIRFRGTNDPVTGTNTTILMAHNRSTALFLFDNTFSVLQWPVTNVAFENLTLRANPHIRPSGVFEPGWHVNVAWTNGSSTNYNCNLSLRTNDWIRVVDWNDKRSGQLIGLRLAHHAVIRHCDFVNSLVPLAMENCSRVLLQSNSFLMVNADSETNLLFARALNPDGSVVNREPSYPLPGNDGYTWNNPSPGPAIYAWTSTNIILLNNFYDGNRGHRPNTNGEATLSDGFVFQTGGGNWFLGDNEIVRYGLEGIYFHSGPNGAAGNRISTEPEANLGAFVIDNASGGVSGGGVFDFSSSMVGNSFVNVKYALVAKPGIVVNFCGNYISNSATLINNSNLAVCQGEPTVAALYLLEYGNFSGNSASNSGSALNCWYAQSAKNLFILGNDFGDIHRTQLAIMGYPYWWAGNQGGAITIQHSDAEAQLTTNAIIARTIMGERETGYLNLPAHVSVRTADGPFVYLLQNAYRNTNNSTTTLKLDPSTAPVRSY
ncbi:MAG TPA: DNRLRE domain-containing protein, partial [Verrucomicrobiae bacterium]